MLSEGDRDYRLRLAGGLRGRPLNLALGATHRDWLGSGADGTCAGGNPSAAVSALDCVNSYNRGYPWGRLLRRPETPPSVGSSLRAASESAILFDSQHRCGIRLRLDRGRSGSAALAVVRILPLRCVHPSDCSAEGRTGSKTSQNRRSA